jgi:glycosyltransferase involved in cell wall biosynthesis
MNSERTPTVIQIGKFYPPHRGGMESHLEALCLGLNESVDLQVVVSNSTGETVVENRKGVRVTRLGRIAEVASTSICPDLPRYLRQNPADVLHLHHPNPMGALAILLSGHRGAIVVTYHSDVIRQRILNQPLQIMMRRLLDRTSAIIVTSPQYLESSPLLASYRDLCHIVPLSAEIARSAEVDPAAVESIRAQYGPRQILSVGRMVYYKGYEYLIEAMRSVNGHAIVIGDGPLRRDLERKARQAGVTEKVSFLGEVADLRPYYLAADVFALPSVARSEAFGIVQLEAMAYGLPIVNTRLDSGVPFVSRDQVTGFTVAPRDPAALGAALQYLLDRYDLRRQFGESARHRAETQFSGERMTASTLDVYNRVTGRPRLRAEIPTWSWLNATKSPSGS